MASRFWVGGTGTWDGAATTHWSATSGGAGGASVPGVADTVTFDANSGGGTVTVNTNFSVVSLTWGAFTGTIDFSVNNNSPTVQTFSGTGTGVRTFKMGSGTFTVTGSGTTIWNMTTTTNLTWDAGTSIINLTYSGAVSTRFFTTGGLNHYTLKVSAGTDIVQFSSNTNLLGDFDTTGFTGTLTPSLSFSIAGHVTLGTGMTFTGGANVLTLNSSTGIKNFTPNAVQVNKPITVAGAASTDGIKLLGSFDMGGASQRALTHTSGVLDLNNFNLTAGSYASNGAGTRSFLMGTGTVTLTNTGTVWNVTGATNLTLTPSTSTIKLTDSSATAKTISSTGYPVGNVWIAAGTGTMSLTGVDCLNLDFTGFAGSASPSSGGLTVRGNLTCVAAMTWASNSNGLTFAGAAGLTQNVTTAGVVMNQPTTINTGALGVVKLLDNFDSGTASSRTLTLTSGTLNLNGFTIKFGLFALGGATVRGVTFGAGIFELTGVGTVWNASPSTNLTVTPDTGTIKLSNASASAKTFAGGDIASYPVLYLTGAGTGTFTITGSNSFAELRCDTPPHTIIFTSGTTTSVVLWTVNGTSGNRTLIQSSIAGSQATITKAASGLGSDYLSVKDLVATGGAAWIVRMPADRGNNTGWRFVYPSMVFDYMGM